MDNTVQEYIDKMRTAGKSDSEIKQDLRNTGWKDEMFSSYFDTKQEPYPSDHSEQELKHNSKVIFIIIGLIIILGVGAYFVFAQTDLFFNDATEEVQQANTDQGEAKTNASATTNAVVNITNGKNGDMLTNNDYSSFTGDAVILRQMTLDDLPGDFQTRPIPIDHQLYDEPELIEVVEGDYPDGQYTIHYDYHFSSYDPNECIPLTEGTPNPYDTDPYETFNYDGCIMDLATISSDETVCDLLDTIYHQNRCKNRMAYRLESPVMCFSIIRPDDLTDEAPLAYEFSGSFSQCMYDSIILGVPSDELCTLLGNTINGDTSWQEECDEELEDYLKYQEIVDDRETAEGVALADPYNSDIVFTNLITADGLILPKTINGGLWLLGLTSAQGLVLPNIITNDLFLYGLESTEGLVLPKSIDSSINIGINSISKEEQSELESKYPELNIQFSL